VTKRLVFIIHREVSDVWVNRCRSQILATLSVLEASRADRPGDYWFGNRIGHADIAVAVVLRFITEAHPGLVSLPNFPALRTDATRLEAMPAFQYWRNGFPAQLLIILSAYQDPAIGLNRLKRR
jgi:glutathione S-transferase